MCLNEKGLISDIFDYQITATKAECPSKTCPNYSTRFSVFPTTQVIYTNTVIESLFVGEILI